MASRDDGYHLEQRRHGPPIDGRNLMELNIGGTETWFSAF